MKTAFAQIGNAFGVALKVYRAPTCSKMDKKVYRPPPKGTRKKFTGPHHSKSLQGPTTKSLHGRVFPKSLRHWDIDKKV